MANLKSLAKDTAIYGVSSIVGRFINYLLVPLYTVKISAESGGYGVITNVYAYTAVLLVILTYGMETTFFRYANKAEEDPRKVYSTTLSMVGLSSLLFISLVFIFIKLHGLCRSSFIRLDNVCYGVYRRFPMYSFRLLTLPKTTLKVCGIKAAFYRT